MYTRKEEVYKYLDSLNIKYKKNAVNNVILLIRISSLILNKDINNIGK